MRIVVHIDRLVLEGLDVGPAQVAGIHQGVQAEISRLFATTPNAPISARREANRPAPQPLTDTSPAGVSAAVAHAVHGAVRGPS